MSAEKIVINKEITVEHIKGVKMVKVMVEQEMDAMAADIANSNGKLVERSNWTDSTGTEKEYHVKDIPEAPPEVTKEPEVVLNDETAGLLVIDESAPITKEAFESLKLAENLTSESVENVLGAETAKGDAELDPFAGSQQTEQVKAQAPVNGKKRGGK